MLNQDLQRATPTQEPFELKAALFGAGTRCERLNVEQAIEAVNKGDQPMWVDIVAQDTATTRSFLIEQLGFHELAVEDALSTDERPALQEYEDTLFLVVPAVLLGAQEEHYEEVSFFLRDQALVTVVTRPLPILETWFGRWVQNPRRIGGSPAFLLHSLVDAIVDLYFPALDRLEDEVEDLGDQIFGGDTSQIKEILLVKRRLLEVRRRLSPVRDILNGLLRRDLPMIPDTVRPYFQDVFDHVLRLSELTDINRDTLASLLDVHLTTVSNNLNNVVRKMTVLSTVLMSMTIVSGIYGMNFKYMPELEWRYGYLFAIGLMITIGVAIVYIFKRIRWI
jgi:magnesium transporter